MSTLEMIGAELTVNSDSTTEAISLSTDSISEASTSELETKSSLASTEASCQ